MGTGPGFPGLPLAIVQPERQFTLLDSNNKKIMFAQHAAGLLDLGNVSAVKARGEDYAPGHGFDTVIARALAALPRLVEIAGHHVREDGVFVALKGRYPAEELEQLEKEMEAASHELQVCTDDGSYGHHGFVTDVLKDVLEGIQSMAIASQKNSGTADQIAEGANEQAASVEEIASTIMIYRFNSIILIPNAVFPALFTF